MKKKINKNTSKRGRPPKTFKPKKQEIKRDRPGRPKKSEVTKSYLPEIPQNKENKIKDKIIFSIFLISFAIFCFSLYVSQKDKIKGLIQNQTKQEKIVYLETNKQENLKEQIEKEEEKNIDEIILQNNSNIEKLDDNQNINKDEKQIILETIYQNINEYNFANIYSYIDDPLKQGSVFKKIFSENRLRRFINNINNNQILLTIKTINQEEQKLNYELTYQVKNEIFIEEREVTFIERDGLQKIGKILCTTTGCSIMPFFNPGRYF